MKHQKFIYVLFLIMISIFNNKLSAADDWAQFNKYKAANDSLISLQDSQRPKVVFMGNSITQGWAEYDPNFFSENNFIGRGISGQTSYQMLLRFREDVINLHPEIVVINAGTNDIAENNHNYNEEITFGNIVSMVELAKANDISVVLTSVLPAVQFPWNNSIPDVKEKILSLNNRIKSYAEKNEIPYTDYYSAMKDNNMDIKEGLSYDGVHPTLEGYKLMEEIILPDLTKLSHNKNNNESNSIYDFNIPTQSGDSISMDQFKEKVLLIVNTASKCGFTPQYKDLESLYEKYHSQGLEILDFPCNQFGNQSPESDEETTQFCQLNYGTQFPQYKKIEVNGEGELPLYGWLKSKKGFEGFDTSTELGELLDKMMTQQNPDYAKSPDIKWNFTKFLVDRKGNVVARFEPTTDMKEVEKQIEALLN